MYIFELIVYKKKKIVLIELYIMIRFFYHFYIHFISRFKMSIWEKKFGL